MRKFCTNLMRVCLLLLLTVMGAKGQISLPKILAHNMVLQQKAQVPIWGTASRGEKITVRFKGQVKQTIADTAGNWKILLDPMNASAIPTDLTITGTNTIVLKNILVGEVWLCSGQSNMEYSMRKNSKAVRMDSSVNSPIDELQHANNPHIRIMLVTSKNLRKSDSLHGGWSIAKDSALRAFSAVGYFFAKELNQHLQVPIGVISAAIPGSDIAPWLSGKLIEGEGHPIALDNSQPGKFFPTMISPLAPFAIKGILWYQGETNCFQNESIEYTYKMNLLINGWRNLWKVDLPFYYVQLSPFYYSKDKSKFPLNEETLPKFWEAQTIGMAIPNTGMAVINDLAKSPEDLHPIGKWEVGRRLAQWPLAKVYGLKITPSGPKYKAMQIVNEKIILSFDYVGKGLINKNGPLNNFTIAGADNNFVPADASISGNKLVVSSDQVKKPMNVRFAWNESAQPNFFNKDGLPAIPFRTDNPLHFTPIK